MSLDSLLTIAIVVGAVVYLYRKFAGSKKNNACGCSSGGGCCGGSQNHGVDTHSCASKH